MDAIEKAGHLGKIDLGMDVAASEFLVPKTGKYDLDFKTENNDKSKQITPAELTKLYADWINNYPLLSIEDPFDQDDWDAYTYMNK